MIPDSWSHTVFKNMFVFCGNFTWYRNKEQFLISLKIFRHAKLWSKSSNDQWTFTKALSFIFRVVLFDSLRITQLRNATHIPSLIPNFHGLPNQTAARSAISFSLFESNLEWNQPSVRLLYLPILPLLHFISKQATGDFFFFLSRNI